MAGQSRIRLAACPRSTPSACSSAPTGPGATRSASCSTAPPSRPPPARPSPPTWGSPRPSSSTTHVSGALQIFTPTVELPLAGHPLVGTAWLLAHTGRAVGTLRPPAGDVPTWTAEGLTWIRARLEWATLYDVAQLETPADVDAFRVPGGDAMVAVWAWEGEGRVRARVFPNGIGIEEDEATGAFALQLGALTGATSSSGRAAAPSCTRARAATAPSPSAAAWRSWASASTRCRSRPDILAGRCPRPAPTPR